MLSPVFVFWENDCVKCNVIFCRQCAASGGSHCGCGWICSACAYNADAICDACEKPIRRGEEDEEKDSDDEDDKDSRDECIELFLENLWEEKSDGERGLEKAIALHHADDPDFDEDAFTEGYRKEFNLKYDDEAWEMFINSSVGKGLRWTPFEHRSPDASYEWQFLIVERQEPLPKRNKGSA